MSSTAGVLADKRAEIAATPIGDKPLDAEEIVARYLAGESMQVLARECGTYRKKLYRFMLAELGGEKYREVVTQCLVNRIADADAMLEAAEGPVEVAKAREIARYARMDFERRRPALYGAKQEVGGGGVTFVMQVANLRGAELEVRAPLALEEETPP